MSNDTKRFVFVIGSKDDFTSVEWLKCSYETREKYYISAPSFSRRTAGRGMGIFYYTLPADTTESMALHIGKGYAFDSGWPKDETYFFCQVEEDKNC